MTQIAAWLDHHHISAAAVIGTIAMLIVASIVILVLNRLLQRWLDYVQGRTRLSHETSRAISRAAAMLWLLTILFILDAWGFGLAGVWTVLVSGITVIGVGFLATWAIISNFTASFFLMLWRPFQFGQTVELLPDNVKGRVAERNMMFTTLREDNGSLVRIPNNLFFQKMFRVSSDAADPTAATV